MQGQLHQLPDEHLGRPGYLWTYGHFGPPILVLPSAGGMAHEWQSHSMIEAHGEALAAGRYKLYCVESNVAETWTCKDRSLDHRMARHRDYEHFILETVVPFIYADCQTDNIPITVVGISVGAMLAVNFTLKYPTVFRHAMGFSGRYDASHFTRGQSSERLYFNNPLSYVPGLEGKALAHVRENARITLVCGRGNWEDGNYEETMLLGHLLKAKGVYCEVDLWGRDSHHQWPYWKLQTLRHFQRVFGG